MPGRSTNKDVPEAPKTCPEIRPARKSLEFRAEVIPYDTCEDPNAPILAFSGDNMNMIFNIPKERFLKLAVAAIGHLKEGDSDLKPPESSSKQSSNLKHNSNELSKSRLSDVVKSLDGDNTNEIVNAYEEDSNESQNSKNKDPVDLKSCEDTSNEPIKLCGESVSNSSETEKSCPNTETNSFEESLNSQSAPSCSDKNLPIEEKYREQSFKVMVSIDRRYIKVKGDDLENESEISNEDCENTEEKSEGSQSSNEHADVEQEQNSEDGESDIEGDMNLSAHSLDISAEDCPELENAWPDIYPYKKTEEIQLTELKSVELKGFIAKYLKLELSNEFVVIRVVTSSSSVLVDAVKYEESISKAGGLEDSNYKDISEMKSLQTSLSDCAMSLPVGHKHVDSVDEEKVTREDKSASCESKDRPVIAEEATGTNFTSKLVDKISDMEAKSLEPKHYLTESKEPISTEALPSRGNSSDCITATVDAGTSKSLELDYEVKDAVPSNAASNVENSSADEVSEIETQNLEFPSALLENIISLKIEQKLEELDINVPGLSPTERLKFTLNDSLKRTCGEIEAEKHMEESALTENVLNESEAEVPSLALSSESVSESVGKYPKEIISQDESIAECSDSCDSNIVMKLGHENKSESLNVSSNAERELAKFDSEHAVSAKNKSNGPSLNCESGLADGDVSAVGKLISNDLILQGKNSSSNADVSLETNIENESTNISPEDKDSLDDSALGKDLHISGSEGFNFSQCETNNAEIESSDKVNDVKKEEAETENIPGESNVNVETILSQSSPFEHATNEPSCKNSKPFVQQNSECINSVSETTGNIEEKLPENSFASNLDSFMDTTIGTNIESASEGGEYESDDANSVASESDENKDYDKQASKRIGCLKKNTCEHDEVDCAPTRVRTKKTISGLSTDVIPENSEVKNGKASKARGSYLNVSVKTPIGRSLRSKSLDPTPQTSKGILHERKHVIAESEEMTRRTRAKTPDIVSKKDLKTTAKSSPRKFTRAASTEPSSASKVESTKTTVADHSKSRANLDSSVSTRRAKRGNKE